MASTNFRQNAENLRALAESLKVEVARIEKRAAEVPEAGALGTLNTPERPEGGDTEGGRYCNWFLGTCFACTEC
jgi:hypothetical protein